METINEVVCRTVFDFMKDEVIERIDKWISYFNDVKLEIENLNKD